MLTLRPEVRVREEAGIRIFLDERSITDSDKKEFISNGKYEAGLSTIDQGSIILGDILFKSNFVRTFQSVIDRLGLSGTETILEMGASHGWASVMLKALHPKSYIVASDLVAQTVEHAAGWEKILGVQIDEKWAFNCREMPFSDSQFDRIFTFASFHHFGIDGNYHLVLAEMVRLLKPGGKIVLLYEPSSPAWCYKSAFQRVNRKRAVDGVDEDVLVCDRLRSDAQTLGCGFRAEMYPIYRFRDGVGSTNYYFLLSKIPPLRRMFPSTVNIVITKAP